MKTIKTLITILLIFALLPLKAKPTLVRMTNVQVDSNGNLIPPSEFLYRDALRLYRKGKKSSALTKFKFAAAFGNKKAVKFTSLMLLDGDGVNKDFIKGLAWLGLSADNGDRESISLLKKFKSGLAPNESSSLESEYNLLNDNYNESAVLYNIYRFYRRYKFQTLDKPNAIKFQGQSVQLNEMQIMRIEKQTREYYIDFKQNMGTVTLGDIIIEKD